MEETKEQRAAKRKSRKVFFEKMTAKAQTMRVKRPRDVVAKNPWLKHVASVRAKNPGKSVVEIAKLASASYKK